MVIKDHRGQEGMIEITGWWSQFFEHVRNAIDGLCPIIGTINLRRRDTDEGESRNVWKNLLGRAVASAMVAIILGISSGAFSAYIMVRVMDSRVNNIDGRVDRLENRFNNLTDEYYRRNNH